MSRKPNVQEPEEEVSHLDDAVIGRAFRWSFVILVVVVAVTAGVIWLNRRKPAPAPPKVTQLSAPAAATRVATEIPNAAFSVVELPFVHNNGAYGDKLLPETMGSGAAFLDFDADGDQDLLLVNSTRWPWKTDMPAGTPALFRNDGKGQFENATAGSGLDVSIYGMGIAAGDYDNDGRVDVFISAVGENHLFHNEGSGKFKAVDGLAGSPQQWSTACAMFDYDNDGDLDLYVGNYVRWSREIDLEVGYKLVGVGRAYGQPMNFEGTFPYLYRNDGNGKFSEVAKEAGLHVKNSSTGVPAAKTLGVAPIDLDGDGWIDFVVANDTVQNLVFHNQRNGTFKEIGALSGVAFDTYGNTRGAMGIDAARYRNDSAVGIAIGNFANEMTALYVSQNNPLTFADEAIPEGIGPASRLLLKFGIFFFDYDLDGRLDVLSANGHLEEEISKIQQSQRYQQPAQLFWNSGAQSGATFVPVSADKAGADLFKPIVGRGSAYADIDGDGDLDVILTQTGNRPLLLRNNQKLQHHWIRLKLIGARGNRDAIGAWIHARVNGTTIARQVMPTRSYLSQSELPVTIGLGKQDHVESLEIVWPGGDKQTVASVRADVLTVVKQAP